MKKKMWIFFSFIVLIIFLSMNAVIQNPDTDTVPTEVMNVYQNYLETIKSDFVKAANLYCHFEMPVIKELVMQSSDYLLEYHVIKWDYISEILWGIEVSITSTYSGERTIYNYIGYVDEAWRVMLNPRQIPEYMLEDIDLGSFSTTGKNVIPYEAVIGLDE